MGHQLAVKGREGAVKLGYQTAVSLGPWSLTKREAEGYELSASILGMDAFRVSQRPLTFVVTVQSGSWRFPVQSLQIVGSSLTAVVGPKE